MHLSELLEDARVASSARSRCSASSTRAPTGASPISSGGPGGSPAQLDAVAPGRARRDPRRGPRRVLRRVLRRARRGVVPVPLGVAGAVGSDAWRRGGCATASRGSGSPPCSPIPARSTTLAAALAPTPVVGVDGDRGDPVAALGVAPHAFVQPSSGTTGDPKGVVIGHARAAREPRRDRRALGPRADRRRAVVAAAVPRHGAHRHDDQRALPRAARSTTGRPRASCAVPGRFLQLVGELGVTMTVAPPFALQLVTRRQQRRPSTVDLSGAALDPRRRGADPPRGPRRRSPPPSRRTGSARRGDARATDSPRRRVGVTAMPHEEPVPGRRPRPHPAVSCGVAAPGRRGRRAPRRARCSSAAPALMDGYLDDPAATAATRGRRLAAHRRHRRRSSTASWSCSAAPRR